MSYRTTITDIAKKLGVSVTLVSFVLNGKSNEMRISKKMTAKVLEMAESMNYKPNYLAKSFRTGKSQTIGVILADISNPFFAKLARFIEIEASQNGYMVMFSSSDEKKSKFASQLESLKNRHVDGLILTPPIGSERQLNGLIEEGMPFVVLDRFFPDVIATTVNINNHQAAYDATLRLIKNKRKKIALLNTNNQLISMQQRVKGYTDALEHMGITPNASTIKHLKFSHEKRPIMNAIKEIVEQKADAVLFTTSKLGILGIECIRELGLSIPEDLSIISFDDTDAYRISSTTISAIKQPIEKMCKEGVKRLLSMINDPDSEKDPEKIELKVEFISRNSCI
jgi:LacI family transcriptional regulator